MGWSIFEDGGSAVYRPSLVTFSLFDLSKSHVEKVTHYACYGSDSYNNQPTHSFDVSFSATTTPRCTVDSKHITQDTTVPFTFNGMFLGTYTYSHRWGFDYWMPVKWHSANGSAGVTFKTYFPCATTGSDGTLSNGAIQMTSYGHDVSTDEACSFLVWSGYNAVVTNAIKTLLGKSSYYSGKTIKLVAYNALSSSDSAPALKDLKLGTDIKVAEETSDGETNYRITLPDLDYYAETGSTTMCYSGGRVFKIYLSVTNVSSSVCICNVLQYRNNTYVYDDTNDFENVLELTDTSFRGTASICYLVAMKEAKTYSMTLSGFPHDVVYRRGEDSDEISFSGVNSSPYKVNIKKSSTSPHDPVYADFFGYTPGLQGESGEGRGLYSQHSLVRIISCYSFTPEGSVSMKSAKGYGKRLRLGFRFAGGDSDVPEKWELKKIGGSSPSTTAVNSFKNRVKLNFRGCDEDGVPIIEFLQKEETAGGTSVGSITIYYYSGLTATLNFTVTGHTVYFGRETDDLLLWNTKVSKVTPEDAMGEDPTVVNENVSGEERTINVTIRGEFTKYYGDPNKIYSSTTATLTQPGEWDWGVDVVDDPTDESYQCQEIPYAE